MASPSVPITIAARGASVAILSRTHKLRMIDFSGTTIKIYNNVRCCEGRRRHCDPANKLSMCRWANAFSLPVHLFVRVYISMRRVPKRRKKKPKYFFTFWVIVNVGIPTALNYEKKRLENMAWQIMPVHLPLCLRVLRRRQDLLPLHFFVNQIYKTWQPWRLMYSILAPGRIEFVVVSVYTFAYKKNSVILMSAKWDSPTAHRVSWTRVLYFL